MKVIIYIDLTNNCHRGLMEEVVKVLKVGSLKLPGTFSITFIFWLIVDTEVDPCVHIHAILGWVGGD